MSIVRGINENKKVVFIFMFLLIFAGIVFADVNFLSKVTVQGLNIYYDKFDGETNDFNSLNETQLKNLENMVLEIFSFGKIEFENFMDVPLMAGEDWTVDFDSDINISNNLINVDNYNLPNIDKSAILTLKNVDFEDPEIWNNNGVCVDCEFISYLGGDFVFRTNSFSGAYFLREKEEPPVCGDGVCEGDENSENCPEDCDDGSGDSGGSSGGGSGGGGSGDIGSDIGGEKPPAGMYDFKIFPPILEMEMRKGTYVKKTIRVENNGSMPLNIGIGVSELSDFIFPEVRGFSIDPGEVRDIRFDIYVSDKRPADVYLGKIIFNSFYVSRNSDVVMNVKEKDALFDIRTIVLKKYISPGNRVRANISLINMGDLRNFDVVLDCKMMDFDNNIYTIRSEQFAINKTYNNIFFLDVPKNSTMGNYVFYSIVKYRDVNATSYDTFVVETISFYFWILLLFLILILMYLAYRWYKKRKYELEKEEEEKVKKIKKKEEKAPELKKIREHVESEKSVDELLPELP